MALPRCPWSPHLRVVVPPDPPWAATVTFRRVDNPTRESTVQVIIFHNEELENVHQAAKSGVSREPLSTIQ